MKLTFLVAMQIHYLIHVDRQRIVPIQTIKTKQKNKKKNSLLPLGKATCICYV